MGRKNKNKNKRKPRELQPDEAFGISFQEEDREIVEQMMLEHLESSFDLSLAEADEQFPMHPPKGARKQSKGIAKAKLDLHGLTLDEAKDRLKEQVEHLRKVGPNPVELEVVTGKGRNSGPAGGVLSKEMHTYARRQFDRNLIAITESPHEAILNGLPLRGSFKMKLKFS